MSQLKGQQAQFLPVRFCLSLIKAVHSVRSILPAPQSAGIGAGNITALEKGQKSSKPFAGKQSNVDKHRCKIYEVLIAKSVRLGYKNVTNMPPTLFILFLCVEIWTSVLKHKTI